MNHMPWHSLLLFEENQIYKSRREKQKKLTNSISGTINESFSHTRSNSFLNLESSVCCDVVKLFRKETKKNKIISILFEFPNLIKITTNEQCAWCWIKFHCPNLSVNVNWCVPISGCWIPILHANISFEKKK